MKTLALVLAFSTALAAEEAPKPATPGAPAAGTNPLVSLDFDDRPFGEVTDYLGRLSGMNVVPAPELAAEKVTVHLIALDWKKALKLAADQVGGYVEEVGPNLVKVSNLPRVTYTTLTTGNDIKEKNLLYL